MRRGAGGPRGKLHVPGEGPELASPLWAEGVCRAGELRVKATVALRGSHVLLEVELKERGPIGSQ